MTDEQIQACSVDHIEPLDVAETIATKAGSRVRMADRKAAR
jgi:hypothetical protein